MNWLRIPELEAGEARQDTYKGEDALIVPCTVVGPPDLPVCCLAPKLRGFGQPKVYYRDRRIEPMPTWLEVSKRKFHCQSCGSYPAEIIPAVDDDHFMTNRLREDVRLSAINRPFNDAVRFHAIEETLVKRVFAKMADEKLEQYRYKAPRVLGVDENVLIGKARGVICDVESDRLLDLVKGYTVDTMMEAVAKHMEDTENIEVWCQDMSPTFLALHNQKCFKHAAVVIDKFHVVRKADEVFDSIRKRATPALPDAIRRKIPGSIKILRKHFDTTEPEIQERIDAILSQSQDMMAGYIVKEAFYNIYDAKDRAEAEARYQEWFMMARATDHAAWRGLMGTVQNWREHIFNYFDHPFTSARVESMNLRVVKMNQEGYGYDFVTLRQKAILRYSKLIPEERFRYYMEESGTGWMDDLLAPDAHLEDDDGTVLLGSGIDVSTMLADLEAGRF